MAYQTIPPSNSGGNDSASIALRRARSLLGSTTINKALGNDFDTDIWYRTAGVVGTGAATPTTTKRGGVLTVTSGATANSTISVLPHGTIVEIGNPQTDLWYACCRAILTTAVDGQTSLQFRVATTGVSNPQAILGLTGSVSSTFFSYFATTNAGAATSGTTSVGVDTSYHKFEIYGNATTLYYLIDEVQVASTAIANIGTNSITPVIQVGNGTTATARTIDVDYIWVCVADPTA